MGGKIPKRVRDMKRDSIATGNSKLSPEQRANRVPNACQAEREVIPQSVIDKQQEYLSAPYRDLTGYLAGDPRIGFSAYDRKRFGA